MPVASLDQMRCKDTEKFCNAKEKYSKNNINSEKWKKKKQLEF